MDGEKKATAYGMHPAPRGVQGSGNNGGAADANKKNTGEQEEIPSVNEARNKVMHYGSRTNY